MQVAKKENKQEVRQRETTVEFLASLAAVLVTGLFIITFVVQAFEIPSSSMENTLLIGDHVFVKRVMGVPGDRIHLRDGVVYRNGEKLNEPYVIHKADSYNPYRDNFPAVSPSDFYGVNPEWQLIMKSHIQGDDIVVPAGAYFAMGDNRDVSLDSRYWGFVPRENVIGRPLFIYWSFETPADQYQQTQISQRLSFLAHVVIHFFDETRWRRTLKAVQ